MSKAARLTLMVALVASCRMDDGPRRIAVSEANDLGVTTIETERIVQNDDSVYELRALDAGGTKVGGVRLHIGIIDDLLEWFPGTERVGSDLSVSLAQQLDRRFISREVNLFLLSRPEHKRLLAIPEVKSTLAQDANILVEPGANSSVSGGGDETAYTVGSCTPSQLLTPGGPTPLAKQCCFDTYKFGYGSAYAQWAHRKFVNSLNGAYV